MRCTVVLALQPQLMLRIYRLSSVPGPGDWDLLVETKGLGFGPHLPPAEGLRRH